ncbi:hypothetical protein AB4Z48_19855 [Cupriavidus sp. 2TAF22]|uniref:hypothetical protein n=1 Tax=unclassified Cupriavidus TaxID=2640874 RepID=UPI003F9032EF
MAVPFMRRARHFEVLNFAFVVAFCAGARMVLDGIDEAARPIWAMLVAGQRPDQSRRSPL